MFGFNFAPRGWASCSGQLIAIQQNTALFSLLGTTFGGDGRTTFGLPDLRGRTPMNSGQGPGLNQRQLGESGGSETVTLSVTQLPPHVHQVSLPCSTDDGNAGAAKGNFPASTPTPNYATVANASMGAGTSGPSGNGQPIPIVPPFLAVNFCIALEGIYPSRP